ncbi:MAG: hypothetical protein ACHQFX_06940 [Chitinophagales bacterium]
MILLLATKYRKHIAYCFFLMFYVMTVLPAYGISGKPRRMMSNYVLAFDSKIRQPIETGIKKELKERGIPENNGTGKINESLNTDMDKGEYIGGPTQPEMSSFKPASADNLVNLFTGDFNYNIPLLDVGGYPVNIFYNAGITPEEEASWVGLGWNINPGTVSRNMRGVPDDFNGTEKLITTQSMKPNETWGGRLGIDFEFAGIKNLAGLSIGASLGASVNNYLGPALDLGVKGGISFKVGSLSGAEKNANAPLNMGVGLNANLSSRGGLTLSPNISLSASKSDKDRRTITGSLGLSTSYNSRYGIKSLELNEQVSFNQKLTSYKVGTFGGHFFLYDVKNYSSSLSASIMSSSISFSKPSYTPSLRMPITNEAYSGHFQLGGAIAGAYLSGEVEVYKHSAYVAAADAVQKKPMVGYMYYEKANANADAIVDFTRFNDKEVTPNTPIISVPQYSYDVFSIAGEGTGGSIRLYRNDYGSVRDNYTKSQDKSLSIGADIGIPGHYGANVNIIKTPSRISEWLINNKLRAAVAFSGANGLHENVYFRNPGETSVLNSDQFDKIGGLDLVRYKIAGSSMNPTLEPVLERFSPDQQKLGEINMVTVNPSDTRKKRTQVVNYFTAEEASIIGLNKQIKSYDLDQPLIQDGQGKWNLNFEPFDRISENYRLAHHISQINVTEADGKRYIYDQPVYNKIQKDFSFTVNTTTATSPDADLISIEPSETRIESQWLDKNSKKDGYLQSNETPAYAHSFLIGGLLSPDYVDVNSDGITEDDLGSAVKFNYTRIRNSGPTGGWAIHKWRSPHGSEVNKANFNAGNRTEIKDDKGNISYGERESWYLHSIESKTMIALFTLEDRQDGKGASDQFGGRVGVGQDNYNAIKRLKKIDLYNKADLRNNGLLNARPVKTVFFQYSYKLCGNSTDNSGITETIPGSQNNMNADKGKLTLERIWFTFNGQNRGNKNQYRFVYENSGGTGNPAYAVSTSDRWGAYKPKAVNPGGIRNADYPYSFQPVTVTEKETMNQYAGAWDLKKILLPSGGQIEIEYESDDYAFVQNKRAAVMMSIAGFGKNSSSFSNDLYSIKVLGFDEHNYVLVNVPEACSGKSDVLKYLKGQEQFAFRLFVRMPKGGYEYVTSYAEIEDYDVNPSNSNQIWIKLKTVDGIGPLSLSALEFLKEQLPGQAFHGHDVSEGPVIQQIGGMIDGLLTGLRDAFRDPIQAIRLENNARYTDLSKCFVRLNDPDGYKYGGGHRVRKVTLKDNWTKMTEKPNQAGQFTSQYGTEYEYETTEVFNGQTRTISSGVASYEPSIGGDENPFQTMFQVINRLPLGPSSYGSIETPVMDAFFPAPLVGYSKVTVRSLKKGPLPEGMKSRSGVGRQVNEFYTAKDFPVYFKHTMLDPSSDIQFHKNNFHLNNVSLFFWKWAFDSRAISQGFLVATNDMHGKMKSQSSFAENDPSTRISYTENFYRNTGTYGLDDKFDFVNNSNEGKIQAGNMGIDVELMTDTREFYVKSASLEVQAQLDYFPIIPPPAFWLPFIWPVKTQGNNVYRAVTCTKVINYHSIIDKVVVIDKGSKVSTENLVFDAETGQPVVTRANNEFDKSIYSISYPAYWAYSGMGLAYKNIDAIYRNVNFLDGKIVGGISQEELKNIFESGDELLITYVGTSAGCSPDMASSSEKQLVWAMNKHKNTGSLTDVNPDFIFIDKDGKPYSRTEVAFKIVRSGKRNMLGSSIAAVAMMSNPIAGVGNDRTLVVNEDNGSSLFKKVINASAIDYKEKWQTDNDVFFRYRIELDTATCEEILVQDCTKELEKKINPYRKGLLGNFRVVENKIFYVNRAETDFAASTDLPKNGFIPGFASYWNPNNDYNLVPSPSLKWVESNFVTRLNAKGMELETKDALNRYTAAQYGYSKTAPVAIASNSRYNEMMFEGFEDNDYSDQLNYSDYNKCSKKHVDIVGENTSLIIDENQAGFNAHTGKKMLGFSDNVFTKEFVVKPETNSDFNLDMQTGVAQALTQQGGTHTVTFGVPDFIFDNAQPQFNFMGNHPSMNATFQPRDLLTGSNPGNRFHYYTVAWFFYINITEAKIYNFSFGLSTAYNNVGVTVQTHSNSLSAQIRDLSGNFIGPLQSVSQASGSFESVYASYTQFLCPGIYKIEGYMAEMYSATDNGLNYTSNSYSWECTNSQSLDYVSPVPQATCTYTKPIPASEEMMNPVFSIPAEKKMLFSAWGRENCGNIQGTIPCTKTSYTDSKVELQFFENGQTIGQPVTITPSGPIIEGWQRYEGYFAAPQNADQMNLKLVNNTGGTIYFDDIRMHPFNANMVSYVYDPVNLRLTSQLDANNYASFYEYDAEGGLVRSKVETKEGIKTINETRSAKQKLIKEVQ